MPENNNDTTYSEGIGFLGLLAIVFITLKLVGYINWSWWMVLAPVLWPFYVVSWWVGTCFLGAQKVMMDLAEYYDLLAQHDWLYEIFTG